MALSFFGRLGHATRAAHDAKVRCALTKALVSTPGQLMLRAALWAISSTSLLPLPGALLASEAIGYLMTGEGELKAKLLVGARAMFRENSFPAREMVDAGTCDAFLRCVVMCVWSCGLVVVCVWSCGRVCVWSCVRGRVVVCVCV